MRLEDPADVAVGFREKRRCRAEAAVGGDEVERADADGRPTRRRQARGEDPRRDLLSAREDRVECRRAQVLEKDGGPGQERELLEGPADLFPQRVADRAGGDDAREALAMPPREKPGDLLDPPLRLPPDRPAASSNASVTPASAETTTTEGPGVPRTSAMAFFIAFASARDAPPNLWTVRPLCARGMRFVPEEDHKDKLPCGLCQVAI